MAVSNGALDEAQTRHAVFLQRRYSGIANEFNPYLNQAQKAIRDALFTADSTIANKRELNKIVKLIEKSLNDIYGNWLSVQNDEFLELATQEVAFQYGIHLTAIQKNNLRTTLVEPTGESAFENAQEEPIVVDNKAITMETMQENWKEQEITRVTSAVTAGFIGGLTVVAINQLIKGTKANNFKDGELATTKRNSDSIVKTQAPHVAQVSKDTFFKSNRSIIGYKILATLDFRTTPICRSLDGRVVLKTDKKQLRPPFHWRCRTVTSAVFNDGSGLESDGELRTARGPEGGTTVSADLTYYEWLKRQPASFHDKALGPTRGKIFRNAGLTPEEFRKASVNKFNEPLTLDEMKREDEEIRQYLEKGE